MTLPILLSVPHAGRRVPPEVEELCTLTPEEIRDDGDEGSDVIYALADHVLGFVTTDVARAVVDMNRARDDRRKDGVVKTHTCWDVPVWRAPLAEATAERLLDRYWRPYHERLAHPPPGAILGVDGHTMAAHGPPVGPDPGRERPWVCLGDGGGALPAAWFDDLCESFAEAFGRAPARNDPFRGGHIVRSRPGGLPWVQVELSRAPYMPDEEKRARVLRALTLWCRRRSGGR